MSFLDCDATIYTVYYAHRRQPATQTKVHYLSTCWPPYQGTLENYLRVLPSKFSTKQIWPEPSQQWVTMVLTFSLHSKFSLQFKVQMLTYQSWIQSVNRWNKKCKCSTLSASMELWENWWNKQKTFFDKKILSERKFSTETLSQKLKPVALEKIQVDDQKHFKNILIFPHFETTNNT